VLAAQPGELLGSAAPALTGRLAARVFRLFGLPFQCRDLKSLQVINTLPWLLTG